MDAVMKLIGWIFLGSLILVAMLAVAAFMVAPEGYEDEEGFHETEG